ncbi:hypothetical protein ITJ54_07625 [Curtobacterium sp. VKM Ac-2865]|uniref:hypothetical protein n=1 Tax=Curtobacterium sp. VKM Ac-2865 TaxID=2783817 RepID=UPI00188AA02B|nr:hypothetical protein [Curtobacterium sp. VKM Ac-2865]MBF4582534.1 hypothetical protein [Curtobacterium sp. VKM Ac-2865]
MSVLAGALTAADVTDVTDDAAALRSAAQRFATATDGVLSAATAASRSWSGLPAVFTSDALQPALTPLMDPAVTKARHLQSAGDAFLRVASRAANRIEELEQSHDALVRQIDAFHASAPGQVAAEAAKAASQGDLLGAVGAVVSNWQQVPALVTEELGLRMRVQAHNDHVTSTLDAVAAELDGITPSTVDAHAVSTAASATSNEAGGGDNWFEDAWHTVKTVTELGVTIAGVQATAGLPYLQDAAATAGNVFASLGNAMVNHPDEVLELLGGLATMALGTAMEGGGVALDLTVVGAPAGVALNVSGAGVIAAGAALAGTGAIGLGVHAMTDDRSTPYRTDNAERARNAKEPNEQHPGRSNDGTYRSDGNQLSQAEVKEKELRGVREVAEDEGLPFRTDQKLAHVDGAPNGRLFDGLLEKPDGTLAGVEVKSGTASRNAQQRLFDDMVSYDNPATVTIDGKVWKITSVILKEVP